jgi:hypothetical protein
MVLSGIVKYIALAFYIALILYGFLGYTTDSSLIGQLRNTNFGEPDSLVLLVAADCYPCNFIWPHLVHDLSG